jgi:hypothetical protein
VSGELPRIVRELIDELKDDPRPEAQQLIADVLAAQLAPKSSRPGLDARGWAHVRAMLALFPEVQARLDACGLTAPPEAN